MKARIPPGAGLLVILGALSGGLTIASSAGATTSRAVLIGVVSDASDGSAVEGAVVIVTGDKLQGERRATTDAGGLYRIQELPPGSYALVVLHRGRGALQRRTGLRVRAGVTLHANISLVSSREVIEVDVLGPTVDVSSSTTGLSIDKEMAWRVPISAPAGKGGVNRSFESVAEAAPGAHTDTYGTSIAGTTSPENKYTIDGLTVNDPAFGLNGTPLSTEFLEETRIEAGGYMPEHGRSGGGIIRAIAKTGSNEFHGGVYAFYVPGALEGRRELPRLEGQTIVTERNLGWIGDAGFDLGGRLVRDKLWFYGGVNVSHTRYDLRSSWNRIVVGPDGEARIDPETKYTLTERIAGTTRTDRARGTNVQVLAKLTYSPARNHTLELLGIHAPQVSGGAGAYGLNARMGVPEVGHIIGDYSALARRYRDDASDLLMKWNARTGDDAWSFDTLVGWHHQRNSALPVDGSALGSTSGLAGTPGVIYRRNDHLAADGAALAPDDPRYREAHAITDFLALPSGAPQGACEPQAFTYEYPTSSLAVTRSIVCPVSQWFRNGPGLLYDRRLNRGQFRHVAMRVARGAGTHVIKLGIDFEYLHYSNDRGLSGGVLYRESADGAVFEDFRQYGSLRGPDTPDVLRTLKRDVASLTLGGFVQDSWSIVDKVTLNAGVRYDAQYTFAGDTKTLAMALPNQVSPRLGVVWDPTQSGAAKLFLNYARFYQNVMLSLADQSGAEPLIRSYHKADGCDPAAQPRDAGCESDEQRVVVGQNWQRPDQRWEQTGGGPVAIDPKLRPQSNDEIVVGGDLELFAGARLGVQYTHRWLNRVIEDMSRDEAQTYFVGNPGHGIAADFPRAVRVYDAASVLLDRRFSRHWLISASYTLSWLRGNISGLFRPENGQLSPNANTDFDLVSLLENRHGYLPGDARHSVKTFMAGEIMVGDTHAILLGGAVRARSGAPTNYLGSHAVYGHSEAYILPRGAGERLPWSFSLDPSVGYRKVFTAHLALTVLIDVFNAANFQQVLAVDQRYTTDDVRPIVGGSPEDLRNLQNSAGLPAAVNPNFGNPTAYQFPRQFRFGIRLTF